MQKIFFVRLSQSVHLWAEEKQTITEVNVMRMSVGNIVFSVLWSQNYDKFKRYHYRHKSYAGTD